MISIETEIAQLQTCFDSFLTKWTSPAEKSRQDLISHAKAVSYALEHLTAQSLADGYKTPLLSIRKRWGRISLQFVQSMEPSTASTKRAEKISKTLQQLQLHFSSNPFNASAPKPKTAAELLHEKRLIDSCKSDLEKLLSPAARRLKENAPHAVEQAKQMIQRIRQGVYGQKLALKLQDPTSPIHYNANFMKLLLVDFCLQSPNRDPRKTFPWLEKSDPKDVEAVKQMLLDLREMLASTSALSDVAASEALMCKEAYFSPELETRLSRLTGDAVYPRATHNALLENLMQHFSPTNEQLFLVAHAIFKTAPTDAFALICHMQGPIQERKKGARHIFEHLVDEDIVATRDLLQQIKERDRDLYLIGMQVVVNKYLSKKTLAAFTRATELAAALQTHQDHPRALKIATAIISTFSAKPLGVTTTPLTVTLLSAVEQKSHLLTLFELLIAKQTKECALNIRAQVKGLQNCPYALASFVYVTAFTDKCFPLPPTLMTQLQSISNPSARTLLIERLVRFASKEFTASVLKPKLEMFASTLKEPGDRDVLFAAAARELSYSSETLKLAHKMASQIRDEEMRNRCKMLLPPRPNKPTAPAMSPIDALALHFLAMNLYNTRNGAN